MRSCGLCNSRPMATWLVFCYLPSYFFSAQFSPCMSVHSSAGRFRLVGVFDCFLQISQNNFTSDGDLPIASDAPVDSSMIAVKFEAHRLRFFRVGFFPLSTNHRVTSHRSPQSARRQTYRLTYKHTHTHRQTDIHTNTLQYVTTAITGTLQGVIRKYITLWDRKVNSAGSQRLKARSQAH